MIKYRKPFLFSAITILSIACIFTACAEERNYSLLAYLEHPVSEAIAECVVSDSAIGEKTAKALGAFGVERADADTLREKLGGAAEDFLGEGRTYLYSERTFTYDGESYLSPAVYVFGSGDDLDHTALIVRDEGGAEVSYSIRVREFLSYQFFPSDGGGYTLIALSNFASALIARSEPVYYLEGETQHSEIVTTQYTLTQYAAYTDDAVTPYLRRQAMDEDMRLPEMDIVLGGVEIGTVPLSRGRE